MIKLLFWIFIGLLGALLYISPNFFIRRISEGFTATAAAPATATATATAADSKENIIANLEKLLDSPDMLTSPTAAPAPVIANGLKAQPQEYETKCTLPATVAAPAQASDVLKQGAAFLETKPAAVAQAPAAAVAQAQAPVIIQREIIQVPAKCPPTPSCPACPDMRDYIRKDSIPCWACKLG